MLPPRTPRLAQRLLAGLGYLVAACALLVGVLRGGSAYFHCGMMNAYLAAPCCDVGHGHEPGVDATHEQGAALHEAPCCNGARLAHLPPSTPGAHPDVIDAPLVAELPSPRPLASRAAPAPLAPRSVQSARDGPPTARARRALLRVYVI